MSPANIDLRISFIELQLKKLKEELKKCYGNSIQQARLIEKIRLKEGEIIGLKWCLK